MGSFAITTSRSLSMRSQASRFGVVVLALICPGILGGQHRLAAQE